MKVIGDLKIKGQVQITGGKPGQDKILTSDPDGLATWETVVDLALQGEKGDKGIQGIKGDKGEQGDSFEYVDFTEEQLAGLKGDKGDKGDTGPVDDKYINDVTFNANQLTITRNDNWSKTINLSGLDNSGLMGAADNDWTISGNNMYSIPTGNVGIGTNSPDDKLHIKGGDIFVDGDNRSVWIGGNGDNDAPRLRLHSATTGAYIDWEGSTSGGLHFRSDISTKVTISSIGNVGIGTTIPDAKLHVEGQVKIQDGTQGDGKVLTSDVNGLAAWKTSPTGSGDGESSFPVGSIIQYAGATAPAGWLLCDGKSYNEFSHTKLFHVIGLTYGGGEETWVPGGETDGGADFRVPLLNGRVPVGRNIGDADFGNLGQMGGEREVTLKDSEIPHKSHKHTIEESGSGHWHPISWVHSGTGNQTGNSNGERAANVLNGHHLKHVDIEKEWTRTGDHTFNGNPTPNGAHAGTNVANTPKQDISQGEHSHSMSNGSATSNSGGGPHNNLQPYIVLNYIIYAGV